MKTGIHFYRAGHEDSGDASTGLTVSTKSMNYFSLCEYREKELTDQLGLGIYTYSSLPTFHMLVYVLRPIFLSSLSFVCTWLSDF